MSVLLVGLGSSTLECVSCVKRHIVFNREGSQIDSLLSTPLVGCWSLVLSRLTQVSKDVDHIVVAWNEYGKPTELVAQKRIIDENATFTNLFVDRPVKKYEGVVYCHECVLIAMSDAKKPLKGHQNVVLIDRFVDHHVEDFVRRRLSQCRT